MRLENILTLLKIPVLAAMLGAGVAFANPPAAVDPCGLITRAEAAKIMGEPMKAGQPREQKATGMRLCLYEAADDNSFAMLQVSIVGGKLAKDSFITIKNNFPDHEAVDGIGDDAFMASPGLHILKSGYYITVAAGNLKRNRDKVLAAGKRAVANLETALK